jgi:hypothetical protein
MKHVKKLGFVMLLALSSGCSVPYWIVLSYDYKNRDEKICIQKVIQNKYGDGYVNRYDELYLQTKLLVLSEGNANHSLSINLLFESTKHGVVYRLQWTGADKNVMAHMSKKINIVNVAQKAETDFLNVLDSCVNGYKVKCLSRLSIKGLIPLCIDE